MKFSVLMSSSSGNCIYLEEDGLSILLDAGISAKALPLKLEKIGVRNPKIDYIFITHEHYDHVHGLVSLYKKYNPMIVMTKKTYNALNEPVKEQISIASFKFIKSDDDFKIDNIVVKSFKVSHDAVDTCGYIINNKLVYLTDTGMFNNIDIVKNKKAYILESNHEPKMLELSNRPWQLIQRIMSDKGHLSNEKSSKLFESLKGDETKALVLYHLSSECNSKDLAIQAYKKVLLDTEISLYVSDKSEPINMIEI